MRIVITGAAGRIGRQMRLDLSSDHDLVLLDRQPGAMKECIRADLTSRRPGRRYRSAWREFPWERHLEGADAILHLAGNPSPWASLEDAMRGNLEATWNLLEAASRQGVARIVHASSWWAAGEEISAAATKGETIPEPTASSPVNPYGLSKAAAEQAGRIAVHSDRVPSFVAVRIGSVVWKPPRTAPRPTRDRISVGVADLRNILRLCLERPSRGFHLVYAVSPTPGAAVDLSNTRALLGWSSVDVPERPCGERRARKTA